MHHARGNKPKRLSRDCRGFHLASLPVVVVVVGFHACLLLIDATSDWLAAYAFTRLLDFTLVMNVVRAAYMLRTCGARAVYVANYRNPAFEDYRATIADRHWITLTRQ